MRIRDHLEMVGKRKHEDTLPDMPALESISGCCSAMVCKGQVCSKCGSQCMKMAVEQAVWTPAWPSIKAMRYKPKQVSDVDAMEVLRHAQSRDLVNVHYKFSSDMGPRSLMGLACSHVVCRLPQTVEPSLMAALYILGFRPSQVGHMRCDIRNASNAMRTAMSRWS